MVMYTRCGLAVLLGMVLLQQSISFSSAAELMRAKRGNLCGNNLVNALKKLCNNCYHDGRDKRSITPFQLTQQNQKESSDLASLNAEGQVHGQQESNNSGSSAKHKRLEGLKASDMELIQYIDGAANKCCINQCTYSELTSYCCRQHSSQEVESYDQPSSDESSK